MRHDKTIDIEGEKMNTNNVHLTESEADSETSFGGEQGSFLDRLGMKIDDTLHSVFTAYVFYFLYSIKKTREVFS